MFEKIKTVAFTESLSTLDSFLGVLLLLFLLLLFFPPEYLSIYFSNEDMINYFKSTRYIFFSYAVTQKMLFSIMFLFVRRFSYHLSNSSSRS